MRMSGHGWWFALVARVRIAVVTALRSEHGVSTLRGTIIARSEDGLHTKQQGLKGYSLEISNLSLLASPKTQIIKALSNAVNNVDIAD